MNMIQRQPVKSSSIRSIGYDPMSKTMEIEFNSGAVYEYRGVTEETYQGLMNADSIGKHFHSEIRPRHTGIPV